MQTPFTVKLASSLEKVFPNTEPVSSPLLGSESVFRGETYSFQIAYQSNSKNVHFSPRVVSPQTGTVRVYAVEFVPSLLPCFEETDDNYLTDRSGIFPDLLRELVPGESAVSIPKRWRSLWVDYIPTDDTPAGKQQITIQLMDEDGDTLNEISLDVFVCDARLPPQTLLYTDWLHCDCIASYYKVPVFSEAHWELVEKFVCSAVECGVNLLLTPLFTPPLDTAVGHERPTVQLVDVALQDGKYSFDFAKLERWIEMCERCGVEYFELSHLFTQWGAKAAPKIVATVNGVEKRIFGWDTPATGEAYRSFLGVFLPALTTFLRQHGIADRCFFHVSDEPTPQNDEGYRAAKELVAPYLQGFRIIDALSDISFYQNGLVEQPISSTDHIEAFIEAKVPELWCYYCCSQGLLVSNRFMAMPSARERILAVSMFLYDVKGFLHWGYNFYYSQYSLKEIDPYRCTDADCSFPSGDAFLVYPGKNGPDLSLRYKVMAQAMADLRAMQWLSALRGKERVVRLIQEGVDYPISFSRYPKDADYLMELRKKLNREIMAALAE